MATTTEEKKVEKAVKAEAPPEKVTFNGKEPKEFLKDMVEAGMHFGHKTSNWNPKMKEYIWGQRNGVYILDLAKTISHLAKAKDFIRKQARLGRNILFVGTKKQAETLIREEAERVGAFYINQRWLGGLITNFDTIRASLNKLRDLETQRDTGFFKDFSKKEVAKINREIAKLNKSLGGLKKMRGRPEVLVVVDQQKELIAVQEAKKAGVPVVSIVDTDSDPTEVDYVVPANDDSIRSIRLLISVLANAVEEGKQKK